MHAALEPSFCVYESRTSRTANMMLRQGGGGLRTDRQCKLRCDPALDVGDGAVHCAPGEALDSGCCLAERRLGLLFAAAVNRQVRAVDATEPVT